MNNNGSYTEIDGNNDEPCPKEKETAENSLESTEGVYQNNELRHSKYPSVSDWEINIDNL